MKDDNIKTFDKFVGYISAELYTAFPVCIKINVCEFLKKIKCEGEEEELIFSETMFWLRGAGFLSFVSPDEKEIFPMEGVVASLQFSCVVLSAKGLEILKKTPKSVESKESIGEMVKNAIKEGSKAKMIEGVNMALGMLF